MVPEAPRAETARPFLNVAPHFPLLYFISRYFGAATPWKKTNTTSPSAHSFLTVALDSDSLPKASARLMVRETLNPAASSAGWSGMAGWSVTAFLLQAASMRNAPIR